jgi:hypothetical protein
LCRERTEIVRRALLVPSAQNKRSRRERESGGKRDRLWRLRRLYTCTPDRSGLVSQC